MPADDRTAILPRCPKCGESYEFGVEMTAVVCSTGKVQGINEHGELVVDWWDGGDPLRLHRPKLECADCGHQWTTTRKWVSASHYDPPTNGSPADHREDDRG